MSEPKFIRFIMRGDMPDVVVDAVQARKILESEMQKVMVVDEYGDWTGETINQADNVGTVPYHERAEYKPFDASHRSAVSIGAVVDNKLAQGKNL